MDAMEERQRRLVARETIRSGSENNIACRTDWSGRVGLNLNQRSTTSVRSTGWPLRQIISTWHPDSVSAIARRAVEIQPVVVTRRIFGDASDPDAARFIAGECQTGHFFPLHFTYDAHDRTRQHRAAESQKRLRILNNTLYQTVIAHSP